MDDGPSPPSALVRSILAEGGPCDAIIPLLAAALSAPSSVDPSTILEVELRGLLLARVSARPPRPALLALVGGALDVAIAAAGSRLLEPAAVFAALEDVFEALAVGDVGPVWALVESRRAALHPLVQGASAQRARLALLRVTSGLLRRLSRSADTVQCGQLLLFLAFILPLSERSGVNVAGAFNVENAARYEGDAGDTGGVIDAAVAWRPPSASGRGGAAAPRKGAEGDGEGGGEGDVPSAAPRFHLDAVASSVAEAYAAAESGGAHTSRAFYSAFWRLQWLFYHPSAAVASSEAWLLTTGTLRAVLRAFEHEDIDSGVAVKTTGGAPSVGGQRGAAAAASLESEEGEAGEGAGAAGAAAAAAAAAAGGSAGAPAHSALAQQGGRGGQSRAAGGAPLVIQRGGSAVALPSLRAPASAPAASSAAAGGSSLPPPPSLTPVTTSPFDKDPGLVSSILRSSTGGTTGGASSSRSPTGEGCKGSPEGEELFGGRYLTSPSLLALELKDAALRRHVILQALAFLQFITNTQAPRSAAGAAAATAGGKGGATAAAEKPLLPLPPGVTPLRDAAALRELCFCLLRRSPPAGPRFARAVATLLVREGQWHAWKIRGAAAFERTLPAAMLPPSLDGTAASALASDSIMPPPPPRALKTSAPPEDLGGGPARPTKRFKSAAAAALAGGGAAAPSRPLAWASAGLGDDLLALCADPARATRPTLSAYVVPLRISLDPDQGIDADASPATDSIYVWRGLRLLSEERLDAGCYAVAVGSKTLTTAVVEAFGIRLPPAPVVQEAVAEVLPEVATAGVVGRENEGAAEL